MFFHSFCLASVTVVFLGIVATVDAKLAQVIESCKDPMTVALTFDDGPYTWSKNISDTLSNAGAKGTFFVNGNNYDCIYNKGPISDIKYAYRKCSSLICFVQSWCDIILGKGHQIGSHTWAHKDLANLTWDQVHDEMYRVELALTRIIGVNPAFMRPPYGSYNDNVRKASAVRNQTLVIWDFDSEDSVGATPQESKSLYDSEIKKHPSNILALNHETYQTTVEQVLPYAIDKLKKAGYKMVTVAECLGQKPYQFERAPGTKDSSWHC